MKKTPRKLVLRSETLRTLAKLDLARAVGGFDSGAAPVPRRLRLGPRSLHRRPGRRHRYSGLPLSMVGRSTSPTRADRAGVAVRAARPLDPRRPAHVNLGDRADGDVGAARPLDRGADKVARRPRRPSGRSARTAQGLARTGRSDRAGRAGRAHPPVGRGNRADVATGAVRPLDRDAHRSTRATCSRARRASC